METVTFFYGTVVTILLQLQFFFFPMTMYNASAPVVPFYHLVSCQRCFHPYQGFVACKGMSTPENCG